MRKMSWMACLWPGLPQLWNHGSWGGLVMALGMALVLDAVLLVSFGWSELIGPGLRSAVWTGLLVLWIGAGYWSTRQSKRTAASCSPDPQEDVFSTALDHYLRGDYYQAEQILQDLLRRNVRDLDSRLMLATLLRHAGRFDEAQRQLDTLARFEGAVKWELEMRQERELLTEARATAAAAA